MAKVGKDIPSKGNSGSANKSPQGEGVYKTRNCLSSERYQAFIENIQEGVYEVDLRGDFIYFNNSLCKIFGYPAEEIQFQNFSNFMDGDESDRAFKNFSEIYQTGRGFSDLVWKIRTKKGDVRFIELSAGLIVSEQGEKLGFRGVIRDITERFKAQEALRESVRRLRTLFDFVPYPMVIFTTDGRVSYLNSAFTEVFGWTLSELEGKRIPYVPPELEEETGENINRLFKDRLIRRHETQRLTKDGKLLDVVLRAAQYLDKEGKPWGELVILRDITQEKRNARNTEALLRISLALPEYPELEDLLHYIGREIQGLLGVEGALVILLDQEKNELFFKAAAYHDSATEEKIRAKEIRYPATKGVSGKVLRTGKPIIVPDTSKDPDFYSVVDTMAGFKTRNMLDVPLKSKDRVIGVLCAMNKKRGVFDQTDIELLNMIGSTVALSIENARVSEELKSAYEEVTSLNRAKDRVINHLSHELKTPLSVLGASINTLSKILSPVPAKDWQPTVQRAKRNLDRLLEVQYEVQDIMLERSYQTHSLLSWLLDECADELEALLSEEVGEGDVVETVRKKIDEIFGPQEMEQEDLHLDKFVSETLEEISPEFSHRDIELVTNLEPVSAIRMPIDPLKKVLVGLIKNAVEYTPDEGKIEISVQDKGEGVELTVKDYGVGITEENSKRIFEGFFSAQETMDYSSKRPFDFNAGGKGADLLRIKIFSERYNFRINMDSSRCVYIPSDSDLCPGRISNCSHVKRREGCLASGGTWFVIFFPKVPHADVAPGVNHFVSSEGKHDEPGD